ncbi:calcium-binding protein [Actinoplanes sp. NPDC024001]|uniref:calcium-binding protein n=1 Tax=Actinoplanes sp. NPDC024001 TaxID=3154598 RepID=UPI0033C047AF
MPLLSRRILTAAGLVVATLASTTFLAAPAQAAAVGSVRLVDPDFVQFTAAKGKVNKLKITMSGRVVTFDDRVAIKAGKGCKAVRGDKTRVKCTVAKKSAAGIHVSLRDRNDSFVNKTKIYVSVKGGAGNDRLSGGADVDYMDGGAGADRIVGGADHDSLFGGSGNDIMHAGAGGDFIDAGDGNDRVYGGPGWDDVLAGAGDDRVWGEADLDRLLGEAGNDWLSGGDYRDGLRGGAGNDILYGDAGDDYLVGEDADDNSRPIGNAAALDKLDGGAHEVDGDICLTLASTKTVNCELAEAPPL